MGKKNKNSQLKKISKKKQPGIKFEIEEDAEEIFQSFLESGHESEDIFINEKEENSLIEETKIKASSRKSSQNFSIDLHGYFLDDAIKRVNQFLDKIIKEGPQTSQIKIITGKGLHSGMSGGVLVVEVYAHVKKKYSKNINQIDPSPAESTINGIPLRGYFNLTLMKK